MLTRRKFIKDVSLSAGALLASSYANAFEAAGEERLVILHTNDVHSRLDPFPLDGSKYAGMGGVAARAAIINEIRKKEKHVLLFDAGDIFQGTPYFNVYKGEPEIKAMSYLNYDAATMGNHDFDAGVDGFAQQLQHANFPILVANYDFTNTSMEGKSKPYHVFKKGKIKVGVFGIGIELRGLVPDNLYGNTMYLDPIATANKVAYDLKQNKKCDLVICLSHLGYKYKDNKVSDLILAKNTDNIDLIIGGHTHTFMEKPDTVFNSRGKEVVVNQVGFAGVYLGRLDYTFSSLKEINLAKTDTVVVREKATI